MGKDMRILLVPKTSVVEVEISNVPCESLSIPGSVRLRQTVFLNEKV